MIRNIPISYFSDFRFLGPFMMFDLNSAVNNYNKLINRTNKLIIRMTADDVPMATASHLVAEIQKRSRLPKNGKFFPFTFPDMSNDCPVDLVLFLRFRPDVYVYVTIIFLDLVLTVFWYVFGLLFNKYVTDSGYVTAFPSWTLIWLRSVEFFMVVLVSGCRGLYPPVSHTIPIMRFRL